jgi:phosphate transport system ATP-binding protein
MIEVLERRAREAKVPALPTKIDVRRLNFFYGKMRALNEVNLAVPANAVTAIIGASGCGKSTLLRAINRIFELYPDQRAEGEIVIDGRNVLDPRYSLSILRRCVGMVFQKPTPFATTIRKNVAFALSYYERLGKRELADRIEDALRQAARVSQRTAFFHMGELVEVGDTSQIFTNPSVPRTQDYITGRFG